MKARSELRLKRAIYEIPTMPMCAMGRALGRRKVRVDWTRGSEESWGREKSGTVVAKYTCNIQICFGVLQNANTNMFRRTANTQICIELLQIYTNTHMYLGVMQIQMQPILSETTNTN